jgi:hypothetical protein
MWRSHDPGVVAEELAVLAANGMNLTRSFCYWPDFHPEPDRLDERMLERFGDFLDRHAETGRGGARPLRRLLEGVLTCCGSRASPRPTASAPSAAASWSR